MTEPWDDLKDGVLGALRESLSEFASDSRVEEFVKAKVADFAREKWLAQTAGTPDERAEHEANLRHLAAQVEAEVAELKIRANTAAKATLSKVLETAGGILLRLAPKLLGGL